METEILFNGTPTQFHAAVSVFVDRLGVQYPTWRFSVHCGPPPDYNPVIMLFLGKETRQVRKEDIRTPEEQLERLRRVPPPENNDDLSHPLRQDGSITPRAIRQIYSNYERRIAELNLLGWVETLPDEQQPQLLIRAQSHLNNQSLLFVSLNDELWPKALDWWKLIRLELERQGWIDIRKPGATTREVVQPPHTEGDLGGKPGRPGLDHVELIYRLVKALKAEEIRVRNKEKTWKEIVRDIKWDRGGNLASQVALLREARAQLARLRTSQKDADRALVNEVMARANETN